MTRTARPWRCRRCLSMNEPRKRRCAACLKPKPKKRRPTHMRALDLPYETYVEINGGETCGICDAPPKAKRLHRDHDHRTHKPRGLLCFPCNAAVRPYMTLDWARRLVAYLERTAA